MRTRNTLSKALALGALVAVTLVTAAIWQAGGVQAGPSPHMRTTFGIISLGPGQTARLNVANPVLVPPDVGDRPDGTSSTLQVTLAFDVFVPPDGPDRPAGSSSADERSSCVNKNQFLRRESCEAMLGPGEAASFDFTNTTELLVKISPAAAVMFEDVHVGKGRAIDDPNAMPTLEVMERTRTLFVLPGVLKGFNPQPDPPGKPAR